MRGDIEALSKNIGNISMINNSRHIDNHNTSHLEMDDILLKMMFDNAERTKNLKDYNISSQATAQNPQSSYSNPFGPNFRKNEPNQMEKRAPEQKKILSENINLQNQDVNSYSSRTQNVNEVANTLMSYSSRGKYDNKENAGYDNRDSKGHSHVMHPNSYSRSTSVETERLKRITQAESRTKGHHCTCSAAEELAQAKIRIEYLENKVKALEEENKVLFSY